MYSMYHIGLLIEWHLSKNMYQIPHAMHSHMIAKIEKAKSDCPFFIGNTTHAPEVTFVLHMSTFTFAFKIYLVDHKE
jgi:hypothetical protein